MLFSLGQIICIDENGEKYHMKIETCSLVNS